MKEAPYFVWRRNDGYVNVSRYRPRDWRGSNGESVTFEHFGEFAKWEDARTCATDAKALTWKRE